MTPLGLQIQDLYPGASIDVEVSSGEKDVPTPDASAIKQKKSVDDDTEDGGASSAKPIASNPTSSNASEQTNPSIADRVASTNPPIGRRRCKRPPPVPKWKQALSSVDQVMTQIELPPYRGPHNPLDLIVVGIIFGHLFETFQRISQATGTGTSPGDDTQPQKKMRQPSLKKILVPR
jgi:hypothetical protein